MGAKNPVNGGRQRLVWWLKLVIPAPREAEAGKLHIHQPGQLSEVLSQNRKLKGSQECSSVVEHLSGLQKALSIPSTDKK